MTLDDDSSMQLMTLPTAVCLMSTGICLLGAPIKTNKAIFNNKICDWVDENFAVARFYSASWGNTVQGEGVDLVLCKWYYRTIFFRSLKGMIWYDIFVNCNWVGTRWQQYNTHLHTNNTQNDTKQTINRRTQKFSKVRAVPHLGELYPGICLTTEEKAWKNLSQGSQRVNGSFIVSCKYYESV
jgi:hypothetical protein